MNCSRAVFVLTIALVAGLFAPSVRSSEPDLVNLYSKLTANLAENSEGGDCSDRSDVWAYKLQRMTGQQVYKALILYTRDVAVGWDYHIAPVVRVQGDWTVFERANGIRKPLSLSAWMDHLNDGVQCDFLDYVPEHVINAYRKKRGFYIYSSRKNRGNCILFIVDSDTESPVPWLLDYSPWKRPFPPVPLDREKAIASCVENGGTLLKNDGTLVRYQSGSFESDPVKYSEWQRFCEEELDSSGP